MQLQMATLERFLCPVDEADVEIILMTEPTYLINMQDSSHPDPAALQATTLVQTLVPTLIDSLNSTTTVTPPQQPSVASSSTVAASVCQQFYNGLIAQSLRRQEEAMLRHEVLDLTAQLSQRQQRLVALQSDSWLASSGGPSVPSVHQT
jgi:hypothetical protein